MSSNKTGGILLVPRLPGIFTDDEYRIVQDMLTLDTASKYHLRRTIPHPGRRARLVEVLGRDPWNGARPKKRVSPPPVAALPSRPIPCAVAVYETVMNACADDELCMAARKAVMRYVANTLEDQKRVIPCANCRRGIDRAKAEAAKKTAHIGALICDCGEEKSREARTCHACASERKRSFRPQPCRGMKEVTA